MNTIVRYDSANHTDSSVSLNFIYKQLLDD